MHHRTKLHQSLKISFQDVGNFCYQKYDNSCQGQIQGQQSPTFLGFTVYEEIAEKYRCKLRQQMSRSNNGLVSLFFRLSVW